MTKKSKAAEQPSDMIVSAMGIGEVYVRVRKDHAYGWQPTVVSSPTIRLAFKGAVMKSPTDCAFNSICGNDVAPHLS